MRKTCSTSTSPQEKGFCDRLKVDWGPTKWLFIILLRGEWTWMKVNRWQQGSRFFVSWKDWSCSSFLPKASTWKSVEEHIRCEFTLFNVVIIVTCHIDFLGTSFKLNVPHARTFWSWCVDPTAHVPVALYIMSSRQEPDSFLTPVSWRYISVKGFLYIIYLQTHEFYAISNVIIIWIYPAFLVFCVHSTCITLHFIAQTSGTAVASKYATFQLGRCRLDEFFGLRRCPLVAVDGVPWLIHWYILKISKHVGNRGLAVESVVKGFWCFSAVANKQLPCMTLYNLEWFNDAEEKCHARLLYKYL